MTSPKRTKPDIITYGDHEIITPDTSKLRRLVRKAAPGDQDPVARAEAALAQISGEFSTWMDDECERLDAARRRVKEVGLNKQTRQELFLSAHDMKGDSATFGYPAVSPAAEACAGCSSRVQIWRGSRRRSSTSTSMRCAPSCANTPAPTSRTSPTR